MRKTLLVIMGPTAVGKTALAIDVAQALGTEIISCDSRQFYQELNIGVARPSDEELAAARHHFIACRSVQSPFNAWQYEQEALNLLNQLFERNDTMVAVGGSGLYVDALCNGIALLPDPSPELRQQLTRQIQEEGLEPLQKQLEALDPEYYAVVDRHNPARLQRALETIITAGRPYSEIIQQSLAPRSFNIVKVALNCDRNLLKDRIYKRVDIMMEEGLLDEVKSVLPQRNINTLNTVGYKELFAHLDGDITLAEAIQQIKNHTWQYAKKQLTWLRRYNNIHWIDRSTTVEEVLGYCN